MSDGGHVCLDWYNERDPSQPTLVILPGLTGKARSSGGGGLVWLACFQVHSLGLLQVAVTRTMCGTGLTTCASRSTGNAGPCLGLELV